MQHAHLHIAEVLKESVRPRGHNCAPLLALSRLGKEFLFPSMAFDTAGAFDLFFFFFRLDRNDTIDVPQTKKKAATGLLLDKLHEQDFAGLIACRGSRALGPISRYRVADILHHMKIVSRASLLDCLLVSFASHVMGCARHIDFTLKNMIILAVPDSLSHH